MRERESKEKNRGITQKRKCLDRKKREKRRERERKRLGPGFLFQEREV